jgi:hypothetical protein
MKTEDGRLKMEYGSTWICQGLFPLIRRRTSASQSDPFSLGEKGAKPRPRKVPRASACSNWLFYLCSSVFICVHLWLTRFSIEVFGQR